mmetsp:Transcript_101124/g.286640  ORF Transcript_101124/g.286640 Transcript_101124/m.286640 type:complete len:204 (+) Transcript_101124:128-739(+)
MTPVFTSGSWRRGSSSRTSATCSASFGQSCDTRASSLRMPCMALWAAACLLQSCWCSCSNCCASRRAASITDSTSAASRSAQVACASAGARADSTPASSTRTLSRAACSRSSSISQPKSAPQGLEAVSTLRASSGSSACAARPLRSLSVDHRGSRGEADENPQLLLSRLSFRSSRGDAEKPNCSAMLGLSKSLAVCGMTGGSG